MPTPDAEDADFAHVDACIASIDATLAGVRAWWEVAAGPIRTLAVRAWVDESRRVRTGLRPGRLPQ